ncbi:hypothetical protein PsorP6_007976 [Peronosclerospora sorghi]|uniref:Uncharacterized protein n=1 Tax=Peronosclerospora sorghi TaxID=230839 RepID=A0ACC0WDP7_9STRA|nr:hypothetical protein PsorP6_007976 [Peronosclerospora sorghi]
MSINCFSSRATVGTESELEAASKLVERAFRLLQKADTRRERVQEAIQDVCSVTQHERTVQLQRLVELKMQLEDELRAVDKELADKRMRLEERAGEREREERATSVANLLELGTIELHGRAHGVLGDAGIRREDFTIIDSNGTLGRAILWSCKVDRDGRGCGNAGNVRHGGKFRDLGHAIVVFSKRGHGRHVRDGTRGPGPSIISTGFGVIGFVKERTFGHLFLPTEDKEREQDTHGQGAKDTPDGKGDIAPVSRFRRDRLMEISRRRVGILLGWRRIWGRYRRWCFRRRGRGQDVFRANFTHHVTLGRNVRHAFGRSIRGPEHRFIGTT